MEAAGEVTPIRADLVQGDDEDEESATGFSDADDYKPPIGPVSIVLAVELCERLTYYTLAGTQKTYFNKQLGYAPASSASINAVFSMLCYMWCLPGGLAADVWGRYRTIVPLASLYAVGTVLVAVATFSGHQQSLKGLFLVGSLGLIPLGTGGIKPNICNFGADQIGDATERQRDHQKRFFSYFYMAINVGVMGAFGYLVNVSTHGIGDFVPVEEGYFAAYIVAAASMAIAVGMFISGSRCYKTSPGGGLEGFVTMVRAVAYSVRNGGGARAIACAIGWVTMPLFFICTIAAALWPPAPEEEATVAADMMNATTGDVYPNIYERHCALPGADIRPPRRLHGGGGGGGGGVAAMLNNVALVLGCISCMCLIVTHRNNNWIKVPPRSKLSTFTVEEVRAGFATIPLVIVVNLSFNLAYNAMNNAMPSQACQMNSLLGGSQLNGAFFNLGDAIAIIAFTPIFESCLYPLIGRWKGSPLRHGQKICTGLLVAALGNAVAAWMEIQRKHSPLMCWEAVSECAPNGIHMRDMSAFWMFVPFALIGAAEILVNPCMYYFCYTAAPPKVRSLVQAFNLFFQGSASNAFTAVVTQYSFPNDFDSGNLEYFYFVNVVCAMLGVLLYFYLTRCGRNGNDIKAEAMEEEFEPTEHETAQRRNGQVAEFSGTSESD